MSIARTSRGASCLFRPCRRRAMRFTAAACREQSSNPPKSTDSNARYQDILSDLAEAASPEEGIKKAFNQWKADTLNRRNPDYISQILRPRPASTTTWPATSSSSASSDIWAQYRARPETISPLDKWNQDVAKIDVNLHLGAKTGRQITVSASRHNDVASKIRILNSLNSRNAILKSAAAQRFHERPGLKRKRLRRLRWRARFKSTFASICNRAVFLAKQGW